MKTAMLTIGSKRGLPSSKMMLQVVDTAYTRSCEQWDTRKDNTLGINVHVYSIYGVRTEWNESFSDAFEEVEDRNIEQYGYGKEPADAQAEVLMDGMGGEYMVFGVELYDSGDGRWGEMVNSNEVDVSHNVLDQMRWDYMSKFKRLYPDHFEWLNSKPWRLVNLVHYS